MTLQARLLTAVAFMATSVTLFPRHNRPEMVDALFTCIKLLHLVSFSAAFGSALWVTFFFGLISFFNIPRHLFGNVRSKVFPANFSWVAIFCAISVASFGYLHPLKSASTAELCQLGLLISAFTFNISNLLVFTPTTLDIMKEKYKAERALSIGKEVGFSWKGVEAAKTNAKLAEANRKFAIRHRMAAFALLMYFVSLVMHSWYLACKLNL